MRLPVALLTTLALSLACAGGPPRPPKPPPFAPIKLISADSNDCSTLFDFCASAQCILENPDHRPQQGVLTYVLLQKNGPSKKVEEDIVLAGGELRTFVRKFPEASAFSAGNIECRIRSLGAVQEFGHD